VPGHGVPTHRDPYEETPFKTWREYLEDQGEIVPGKRIDFRRLRADHGIWPRELDTECPSDYWIDNWCRRESSNALAYRYLERLDLGPILDGRDAEMGYLDFVDGACPGNDYLGVQYSCDRALSHLQNRLNELGTGAAVAVVP
jgi:hypothetical protein